MPEALSQDLRLLAIDTPLGADKLALTDLEGEESLSQLFRFRLGMVSAEQTIDPADLLGKTVTAKVRYAADSERLISGEVVRFGPGGAGGRGYRAYYAEIAPTFWYATRASDNRIFQEKSVKDIVETVFKDLGLTNYKWGAVNGTHPQRDYCVQYRETTFDFVSRLLEEEGFFYFFEHAAGGHTMIIADDASAYVECDDDTVEYSSAQPNRMDVTAWSPRFDFRTGKWTQRDFNFEKPSPSDNLETQTSTVLSISKFKDYEFYDYPGRYALKADGDGLTKARMEAEEAGYETAGGEGGYASFIPGAKFKFSKHFDAAVKNRKFVLTQVRHSASDHSHESGGGGASYANSFGCMPADVAFRPARPIARAMAGGPQTATVVGPSGEEIHCDKYGRVKVQFHWDRKGENDDKSSCWLRVAQLWAGKNWGSMFIPRIGMEVIVDFLDGDPDRPIVTGCVYNGDNGVPYKLPDNKTQSGVLTRSATKGGADNFNELRFEDKKGSEQVYFHAEKDFERHVENDDKLTVENDRAVEVQNDESITVRNDQTVKVENNRATTVTQADALTISNGDLSVTANSGAIAIKASAGTVTVEGMQAVELKVGSNSVKVEQSGITIKGVMVTVKSDAAMSVKGTMTEVSGDAVLNLKGGLIKLN